MKALFILIISVLLIGNSYSQDVRSILKGKTFNESDFFVPNDSCAALNPERHDDFTHENGYLLSSDSTRFVLKMTPASYPWNYSKVCVAWTRLNGASGNINYDIVVYDTTGPGGVPGNLVAFVPGQSLSGITIFPQAVWNSTSVTLPTLNNGSYYIGVRWKNSANPNTFVSGDESGTTALWPGFSSGTTAGTPIWNFVQSTYPAYKCLCIRTEGAPPPVLPPFSCANGVPYVPITGTDGPTGDDVTMNVPLPFTFIYQGGSFTSVSICTNGWVVLGVTTATEFNQNLCTTTSGLLRLFAGYWDDLLPTAGMIQYTTLGSAPNRIFVVQYTNVPFFSGTGNVTFQVRLLETSNIIDFIYGPSTANAGASGHIGINRAPGGTGNITNVIPGANCGSTNTSNSICTNVPYNLATGTLYRFGTGGVVGIGNNTNTPEKFSLSQNYPNPFNPTTIITYGLPKSGNVELKIYDILGREVKTLVNEFKQAGTYDISFDAPNFASGLYFYTLSSGDFKETKKMLLVK